MHYLKIFLEDVRIFFLENWKILLLGLLAILIVGFFEKGNIYLNTMVVSLHVIGDIFIIMSMKMFANDYKKQATIYLVFGNIILTSIGFIAIIQSDYQKNWQYVIASAPFVIPSLYQICDAWGISNKIFNYKMNLLVVMTTFIIYSYTDLIYDHVWLYVVASAGFALGLSVQDSPRIYLLRVYCVLLLSIGALIDVFVQYMTPGDIPANSISSALVAFMAFLGMKKTSYKYQTKKEWEFRLLKLLQ